jgi:UPF0042 nucleotide-binding protein
MRQMDEISSDRTIESLASLVVITGLSGAGKSTAMRVFEDLGCYCVDNLPPGHIPDFFNLYERSCSAGSCLVIASDVRSGALFDDFVETHKALREEGMNLQILYLDSSTHVLINRFNEVRRKHPLQSDFSIKDAIEEERRRLEPIRAVATHVIDTSGLDTSQLRETILHTMAGEDTGNVIRLKFVSFGFKYGIPMDADFVLDVRFLPNPFYIQELRVHTGEDRDVYNYVMACDEADGFFDRAVEMLEVTLESFVRVGKLNLNVGIGCTGGRHRSVAFALRLAEHFNKKGHRSAAVHRDAGKLQN